MAGISNSAIIVLCIIAAGIVVLIGWAITHRMRGGEEDDERAYYATETGATAPSQFTHQRDLRERYKEEIMTRFKPRPQRPRQQSFPMSSGGQTSVPSDYY